MSGSHDWARIWRAAFELERRHRRYLERILGQPQNQPLSSREWPDERRCLFCRCYCETGGEQHHFPIPDRLGGDTTVLVCRSCHDKADRIPLSHFDPDHRLRVWQSLWDRAWPEERILLWKLQSIIWDVLPREGS